MAGLRVSAKGAVGRAVTGREDALSGAVFREVMKPFLVPVPNRLHPDVLSGEGSLCRDRARDICLGCFL